MQPIVALLTDFGNTDIYVGAVKGAILAACPEATLVDLVHDIPAHDVTAAAFSLAASVPSFPGGTVFLAVVDPGVGTSRRGLALEAGGYFFVGPDNGIFTFVLAERTPFRIRALTNSGLFRHEVSATFHARDIFGPVAGHLARGLPLDEVGSEVTDPVRLPEEPLRLGPRGDWEAVIVHVDRFGNLVTNVSRSDLNAISDDPSELLVQIQGAVLPIARTYADVAEGEPCALLGGTGRLEIVVNQGSAARKLGAGRGSGLRIVSPHRRVEPSPQE